MSRKAIFLHGGGSFLCFDEATIEYEKELKFWGLKNSSTEEVFFTPGELQASKDFVSRLESSFDERICNQIENEFLKKYGVREFVKTISIPVLNVFGEKDIRIPARRLRTYDQISNKIQNLEIKDAGHFPFILPDHRQQVVSAIRQFVRN